MAQQLIYTSASQGLRPGTSGFCTVACTEAMAPNVVRMLESISGYNPIGIDDGSGPSADKQPVSYFHVVSKIGSQSVNVLSRTCFAGYDHTGRTNKLAHHILVDADDKTVTDPTTPLGSSLFRTSWNEKPSVLPRSQMKPYTNSTKGCEMWQKLTNKKEWAGVLIHPYLINKPAQVVYFVFDPMNPNHCSDNLLKLVDEALSLLPPKKRWEVTFNTYFQVNQPSITCQWRFCPKGSPRLTPAATRSAAHLIDLTNPSSLNLPAPQNAPRYSDCLAAAMGTIPTPLVIQAAEPVKEIARPTEEAAIAPTESERAAPTLATKLKLKLKAPTFHRTVGADINYQQPSSQLQKKQERTLITVVISLMVIIAGVAVFFIYKPEQSDVKGTQKPKQVAKPAPIAQSNTFKVKDKQSKESSKEASIKKVENKGVATESSNNETAKNNAVLSKEKSKSAKEALIPNKDTDKSTLANALNDNKKNIGFTVKLKEKYQSISNIELRKEENDGYKVEQKDGQWIVKKEEGALWLPQFTINLAGESDVKVEFPRSTFKRKTLKNLVLKDKQGDEVTLPFQLTDEQLPLLANDSVTNNKMKINLKKALARFKKGTKNLNNKITKSMSSLKKEGRKINNNAVNKCKEKIENLAGNIIQYDRTNLTIKAFTRYFRGINTKWLPKETKDLLTKCKKFRKLKKPEKITLQQEIYTYTATNKKQKNHLKKLAEKIQKRFDQEKKAIKEKIAKLEALKKQQSKTIPSIQKQKKQLEDLIKKGKKNKKKIETGVTKFKQELKQKLKQYLEKYNAIISTSKKSKKN